jgi:hypothetical protein
MAYCPGEKLKGRADLKRTLLTAGLSAPVEVTTARNVCAG